MDEDLELDVGTFVADVCDLVQRELPGEHDALEAQVLHCLHAFDRMDCQLSRAVEWQAGEVAPDDVDEAEVLDDDAVRLVEGDVRQQSDCLGDLAVVDEGVDCDVDLLPLAAGQPSDDGEVVQREVDGTLACREILHSEVDRVGSGREGRHGAVELACGQCEFYHDQGL